MLRNCRLREYGVRRLPSGRNDERYEARRQSGVATTQPKGCGYGAGKMGRGGERSRQLRERLRRARASGVPGEIFPLYLFGDALIVKTLVQGE
jgi:hypothetical protein